MKPLLVIVPSRGRPDNVDELVKSFADTQSQYADLLIAIDDDDEAKYRYLNKEIWVTVGPRLRLGGTLNATSKKFVRKYKYIGFMGDDHRPRTQDWDAKMMDAIGEFGLAYGNDLIQGADLPTAIVMSSNIISALGYMAPPGLKHMYLDNFWHQLGTRLDRIRYLPEVVIEHLHPLGGKVDWDNGYEEANALMDEDFTAYTKYLTERFHEDVEKLEGMKNGSAII